MTESYNGHSEKLRQRRRGILQAAGGVALLGVTLIGVGLHESDAQGFVPGYNVDGVLDETELFPALASATGSIILIQQGNRNISQSRED